MDLIITKKIIIFIVTLIGLIATIIFAGATYELENGESRGRKPAKWMYIYCPFYFLSMIGAGMYFLFCNIII